MSVVLYACLGLKILDLDLVCIGWLGGKGAAGGNEENSEEDAGFVSWVGTVCNSEEVELEDLDGGNGVGSCGVMWEENGIGPRLEAVDGRVGPDPKIGVSGHKWKYRAVCNQCGLEDEAVLESCLWLWKGKMDSVNITWREV